MSVINATPDSFSGDGLMVRRRPADVVDAALRRAEEALAAGADWLDVGGESTRPGAERVDVDEERARVVPVMRALRSRVDVPISIDTSRAAVAEAALDAGADLVNDVWALRADPAMAPLIARRGVPVILMHNRAAPQGVEERKTLGGRYIDVEYDDLVAEVSSALLAFVAAAKEAGIADTQIVLDPGLGFGKTVGQNLALLDSTDELRSLGFPLLVGTSRKSFIGYTLDLPPDDRVEGTAATVAIAIARGADIVRVHDTRAMVRVARMTDAIVRRLAQEASAGASR